MSVKTALRVIEIIETYARERAPCLSELARLLDVPVSRLPGADPHADRAGLSL